MNNIYERYHERGLHNYKLTSLDDIKAIYGYNIPLLKGYKDLSTENKELFNKFIVNFFNAQGMDRRMTITPIQVNYVMQIYYSRQSKESDNDYEVVAREFKRLTNKGRYAKFRMCKFVDNIEFSKCKTNISYFLRIDYKWGTQREWLHILEPDQWY